MFPGGLNRAQRARDLDALLGGAAVDLLVVGGGVTGVATAFDAATRGLSVALLERRDLAHGTSRWSSKLAHGGLRYLSSGQVGIAWESARERDLLLTRLAPHLIRPLAMLVPLPYAMGRRKRGMYLTGLRLGDALRRIAGTHQRELPNARWITAEEATRWVPALGAGRLHGAILHWDGQLEDDARLVVEWARTAAAHGAKVVTRAAVTGLQPGGATVRDELTGATGELKARHTVLATGVWAPELAPHVRLRPSRGSHVLLPAARLGDPRAALSVEVGGGRFVFGLPRPDGHILVGLTDEAVDRIEDEPAVPEADERFLLDALSSALDAPVRHEDVIGRFAGLRPLLEGEGGATADLSRRHAVIADPTTGALTIVGGKLTTARRMAQDAVDRLPGVPRSRTAKLALLGAQGPPPAGVPARLARRYGALAGEVAALAEGRPELLKPVAAGVLGVEILHAVACEGALTVEDIVDRRTRAGIVDADREAALAAAARLSGAEVAVEQRP